MKITLRICILVCAIASHLLDARIQTQSYDLTLCAIFRDEARFMTEWIEFHRVVGVNHFILYNNRSSDDYQEILAPYIESNIVELIEWDYSFETHKEWIAIQVGAYNDALKRVRNSTKWLGFLDLDEFLFCPSGQLLPEFLNNYVGFGGVGVNWQLFGTSNVQEVPPNKLMIEMLMYKAPQDYFGNVYIKSIVQPHRVKKCVSAHHCSFKKGYLLITSDKKTIVGKQTEHITIDDIRINHYWSRDEKFFNEVKVPRQQEKKWGVDRVHDRVKESNCVYDTAILQYVERVKKSMRIP